MDLNSSKWRIIVLLMAIRITRIGTKDLSDNERASRANFIQKIVNEQKKKDGSIRLLGGRNEFEGNVYIYHAGRWGAICDDSWDDVAAGVVCKQFNKSGVATYGAAFGDAKRKYWMDDVTCDGTEKHISECTFPGWGNSNCRPSSAAGVKCMGKIKLKYEELRTRKDKLKDILKTKSLRLVGGRDNREGRVEIFRNNTWGGICPNGWTLTEAMIVCRHLAAGFAEQALQSNIFGRSKITLGRVECTGHETDFFQCLSIGDESCPGNEDKVAAVVCTEHLADLSLDGLVIEQTAHLQDVPMYQLECAMEEFCLSNSAYKIKKTNPKGWQLETRRLLRFTASSLNIGNGEFRPYLPKNMWQWHMCHKHYHSMEVFATFDILNSTGVRVAEGHKASFCLEDNTCLPDVQRKYNCRNYGDQGISVNCSDVYAYNIDCQWVDVTDVQPGNYIFKVAVNPQMRIAEQRFDNNAVVCNLTLTETYASLVGCNHQQIDMPRRLPSYD